MTLYSDGPFSRTTAVTKHMAIIFAHRLCDFGADLLSQAYKRRVESLHSPREVVPGCSKTFSEPMLCISGKLRRCTSS